MRIAALYHEPYERPGYILDWIVTRKHALSEFNLYETHMLPSPDNFDLLLIMGGSMSVNNETEFPWLRAEKELVRKSADSGKAVFGICLGAQVIASALGAKVYANRHKEIGWFPVAISTHPDITRLFSGAPGEVTVFHWHGETFDLPDKAISLGSSSATTCQGFLYGKRLLGIQFHLEMKTENLAEMIRYAGHELTDGPFIRTGEEIMAETVQLKLNHRLLEGCLNYFENMFRKEP